MYLSLLSAKSLLLMLSLLKLENRSVLIFHFLLLISITLILGFRHQVGVDWGNNLLDWKRIVVLNFSEVVSLIAADKGYRYLIWFFGVFVGINIYAFNFLIMAFYVFALQNLTVKLEGKTFATVVAFPYLTVVVSQGYIKQIIAISLMFFVLAAFKEKRWKKPLWVIGVILASTIHTPALILLPLIIFWNKRSLIFNLIISVIGLFSLFLFLENFLVTFTKIASQYFYDGYYSSGTYLRAAIFFFNFIIFLLFSNLFQKEQRSFLMFSFLYFSIIYSSVVFLGPLMQIDRLGLYSYVFQIYAVTHIFVNLNTGSRTLRNLHHSHLHFGLHPYTETLHKFD